MPYRFHPIAPSSPTVFALDAHAREVEIKEKREQIKCAPFSNTGERRTPTAPEPTRLPIDLFTSPHFPALSLPSPHHLRLHKIRDARKGESQRENTATVCIPTGHWIGCGRVIQHTRPRRHADSPSLIAPNYLPTGIVHYFIPTFQ